MSTEAVRITITVPAIPIAQPRQRHRVVNGVAMNYTPTKSPVNDFKATVRLAAMQVYSGPPLDGPIRMDVTFVMPRTKGQTWKTKPMPRLPHAKKPDRDNLEKSLMDALKGLVFVDDSQVCAGEVAKVIASGSEQPHVEIQISQL